MPRFVSSLLVFSILWGASALPLHAEMPRYMALQRPAAYPHSKKISQPMVVRAQPYPYGYFGAVTSAGQWSSHHGYYNNFSQWTRR